MKLTWIGHSCFRLDADGTSLVFDPYRSGSVPGLKDVAETADAVLCSHEHGDHAGREAVTLTGKPCGMTVTAIETYHDDARGKLRGLNTIHLVEAGGVKVAHFGDLGCDLPPEQMAQLSGLDVAMIPVGGFFTINGEKAAAIIRDLAPKTVIPMHYRAKGFGFPIIGTAEKFLSRMDKVIRTDGSVYDTENPISGAVVLTPANKA